MVISRDESSERELGVQCSAGNAHERQKSCPRLSAAVRVGGNFPATGFQNPPVDEMTKLQKRALPARALPSTAAQQKLPDIVQPNTAPSA